MAAFEIRTPKLSESETQKKSADQVLNMNALNITASSSILSNLIDLKKLATEYRPELKSYYILNRSGIRLMMRQESGSSNQFM